jgi:cytochrome c553
MKTMRAIQGGLALGVVLRASPLVMQAEADDAPPAWAYPVNPPDFKVQPDDGIPRHVPDSTAAFTVTQARDLFFALDWHPSDHPPLPDIVARGRKPDVMACGVCHRADGPGGPENAGIAGLPAQYVVQQMADFKSGARTTSAPQRIPPQLMIKTATGITDAEIEQAAAYFSGLKPRAVIKVVETATVPKTRHVGDKVGSCVAHLKALQVLRNLNDAAGDRLSIAAQQRRQEPPGDTHRTSRLSSPVTNDS